MCRDIQKYESLKRLRREQGQDDQWEPTPLWIEFDLPYWGEADEKERGSKITPKRGVVIIDMNDLSERSS